MSIFVPKLILKDVTDITLTLLEKYKISALVLDVDNTLTVHGSQEVQEKILDWISLMKKNGIGLILVSNNSPARIAPFAQKIDIPFIAMGLKPMTHGFTKAITLLNRRNNEVAVVGDQIYTDVLGGNIKGIFTILVAPFELEEKFFFKVKRMMEKSHIKKYYSDLK